MGHLVRLSYPEAPSGSWSIAEHATSAAGTAYSDWDCTIPTTSRALTANGRATFYVASASDITVFNANGVQVDTFTEGARAELVDVRSPVWTGTLPNGTQGLGGYLALESLIENLAASFGSEDGYVLETAQTTPRLLKDALQQIRSANFPYVNVKSAPYNATGDGVTNDFPAIQAAINAAGVNGVVLFPPGTYLTHSSLSANFNGITLLGTSPYSSTILYDGSSSYALGAFSQGMTVSSLGFNAPNGGTFMQIGDGGTSTPLTIYNCYFQSGATSIPNAIQVSCSLVFANCFSRATMTTASRGLIEVTTGNTSTLIGNTFLNLGGLGGAAIRAFSTAGGRIVATGNVTNNYLACIDVGTTTVATSGNFTLSIGLVYCTATGADATVFEAGTATSTTLSSFIPVQFATSPTGTGSVASRFAGLLKGTGTSFTPSASFFYNFFDATGNVTINAAGAYFDGAELVISIRNTTGGAITVTWNAEYLGGPTANIAAGATRVTRYVRKQSGSSPGWRYSIHADTA